LAITLAIKQYNGIKHTNDETDAGFLWRLSADTNAMENGK
jgi:hypothetical protein